MHSTFRILTLLFLAAALLNPVATLPVRSAVAASLPSLDDDEGSEEDDDENGDEEDEQTDSQDKHEQNESDDDDESVVSVAPHRVEVICEANPETSGTSCQFTAGSPEDGDEEAGKLFIEEETLCSSVVGGNMERIDQSEDDDDDEGFVRAGFLSDGEAAQITLEFSGMVAAGGSATYWIIRDEAVRPARGPGLICGGEITTTPTAATLRLTPVAAGTAAPKANAEGSVLVTVFSCPVEAAAPSVDWFGVCTQGGVDRRFVLDPDREGDGNASIATGDSGEVWFTSLRPGTYKLDTVNGAWCHAESDGVDANGHLVVGAGEEVSVWIFICGQPAAK